MPFFKRIVAAINHGIDPHQEARRKDATDVVLQRLKASPKTFDLQRATVDLELFGEDVKAVAQHVYRHFLNRAWQDGTISEREQSDLLFIAKALQISAADKQRLDYSGFEELVLSAISKAFETGALLESDFQPLHRAGTSAGGDGALKVRGVVRANAQRVADLAFARWLSRPFSAPEWQRLRRGIEHFGVDAKLLNELLRPAAAALVREKLAEAVADGHVDLAEVNELQSLVREFDLDHRTRTRVETEIFRVNQLHDVNQGRLPRIDHIFDGMKAGEIVHFASRCKYTIKKKLKSGDRFDSFHGTLILTDARLIFMGVERSSALGHRKILSVDESRGGFYLTVEGRGSGWYAGFADTALVRAMVAAAVGKANQRLVAPRELNSRHIPRDVRQRVWQRDGGQCVECGATDYLEFDHIVPHSRGGANTQNNVQLLCRRCNLAKSDQI